MYRCIEGLEYINKDARVSVFLYGVLERGTLEGMKGVCSNFVYRRITRCPTP